MDEEKIKECIYKIKECIDSVYGCDCAYFDVDGFAIASAIYNEGFSKQSEGEWIKDSLVDGAVTCSVCSYTDYRFNYARNEFGSNFCPNCGAKMKKGEDI